MDSIDLKLIDLLKENARFSNHDLATMIGITEGDVSSRLQSLIDKGVISQFTAVINENLLPSPPARALVELSIHLQKGAGYESIAKKIAGFSNVVAHYLVSGQYDFLVVVEGNDHKDIAHFVFDKLATLDHVNSTNTHFIFKSYKENGVLLANSLPHDTRLPVQP